jgi:hypothetical protein
MTTGSGLGFGDRAEAGGPVDPGPVPDAVGDAPRRAAGLRVSVRRMSARGAADADPVTRCPADRPRGGRGPSAWREDPARPGRRGRPISSGSRLSPGARGGRTAGAGARGGVEPGCASAACALPGIRRSRRRRPRRAHPVPTRWMPDAARSPAHPSRGRVSRPAHHGLAGCHGRDRRAARPGPGRSRWDGAERHAPVADPARASRAPARLARHSRTGRWGHRVRRASSAEMDIRRARGRGRAAP